MKKLILFLALVSITFTSCARRVVVAQPSEKVVVVQTAPKKYRIVYIQGKRYYKWNGNYYRKSKRGYVRVNVRTI